MEEEDLLQADLLTAEVRAEVLVQSGYATETVTVSDLQLTILKESHIAFFAASDNKTAVGCNPSAYRC